MDCPVAQLDDRRFLPVSGQFCSWRGARQFSASDRHPRRQEHSHEPLRPPHPCPHHHRCSAPQCDRRHHGQGHHRRCHQNHRRRPGHGRRRAGHRPRPGSPAGSTSTARRRRQQPTSSVARRSTPIPTPTARCAASSPHRRRLGYGSMGEALQAQPEMMASSAATPTATHDNTMKRGLRHLRRRGSPASMMTDGLLAWAASRSRFITGTTATPRRHATIGRHILSRAVAPRRPGARRDADQRRRPADDATMTASSARRCHSCSPPSPPPSGGAGTPPGANQQALKFSGEVLLPES